MTTTPSSGAADRTFDILEAVFELGVCRVDAIAEFTGLPSSTIHRIVSRLAGRGYLFSPRSGHYMIGPMLSRLGQSTCEQKRLAEAARPLLENLSRKTGLHTHFGILQNDMVRYMVICVNGKHPISRIEGTQLEAYCSGIGKALIANESPQKRTEYLANGEFVAITRNTMTDPIELDRHFATIRETGFAFDDEEIVPGLRCVAVAIFDNDQKVMAAISASGPSEQLAGRKVASISSALAKIARQLAGKLPC